MTPDIRDIIEEAMNKGCDYCDLITLILDEDVSCYEHCPFNMENADKCVFTNIADAVI